MWTDVSEERINCIFRLGQAPAAHWFLAQLIFYPEDGGDMFHWNVRSHMDYMVPYPRRWQLSFTVEISLGFSVRILCLFLRRDHIREWEPQLSHRSNVSARFSLLAVGNSHESESSSCHTEVMLVHDSVYLLLVMLGLCASGIPDERGRRALCWKLLLNYLPLTRASWKGTLKSKRELYRQFIGEFYVLLPLYVVCWYASVWHW
jgi:hypothetical protein